MPGDDTFSTKRVMFTEQAACLQRKPIAVENGIELIKGERPRTTGTDEEQVALGEAGLNGRDVDGLQQLRLEQFTDPGDLVARQHRVRIGQKPVRGKVRGIDVHRFPAFHQGQLLEAQITIDPAKAGAAGRQVRVEQQP